MTINFAAELVDQAQSINDPLWRMPLWAPYQSMLASKIADVNHISSGGFAGSVTAALFLSRFVEKAESWTHFDNFWMDTIGKNPGRRLGVKPSASGRSTRC